MLEHKLEKVMNEPNTLHSWREPGQFIRALGEVGYVMECTPTQVSYAPNQIKCTVEAPVYMPDNKTVTYLVPGSRLLTSEYTEIPCNPIMPPMYRFGNMWFSLGVQLVQSVVPKSERPTWDPGEAPTLLTGLIKMGLYSTEQINLAVRTMVFPVARAARVSKWVVDSIEASPSDYSLSSSLSKIDIKSISRRITAQTWGALVKLGTLVNGAVGAFVIIAFTKLIISRLINVAMIYSTYGLSKQLFKGLFDVLTLETLTKSLRSSGSRDRTDKAEKEKDDRNRKVDIEDLDEVSAPLYPGESGDLPGEMTVEYCGNRVKVTSLIKDGPNGWLVCFAGMYTPIVVKGVISDGCKISNDGKKNYVM
jgi:hypothetical protein